MIPGGAKGAETISHNSEVQDLIRYYHQEPKKLVGMICAGKLANSFPLIQDQFSLGSLAAHTSGLPRSKITSHPSVKEQLDKGIILK